MSFTGCPELFRQYNNSHMFLGVLRPLTSLSACKQECLETRNCIGIDWNKLNITENSRRCFFIFPESTRYGLYPSTDYCCDHFRRTYCLSTPVTHHTTAPTTLRTSVQPTSMSSPVTLNITTRTSFTTSAQPATVSSPVSLNITTRTSLATSAQSTSMDLNTTFSRDDVSDGTTPQPQTSGVSDAGNSDTPLMNSSRLSDTPPMISTAGRVCHH